MHFGWLSFSNFSRGLINNHLHGMNRFVGLSSKHRLNHLGRLSLSLGLKHVNIFAISNFPILLRHAQMSTFWTSTRMLENISRLGILRAK